MTTLRLRDRQIDSVFELIGTDENSLTYAFGWCLAQVPALLAAVAQQLQRPPPGTDAEVRLQTYGAGTGITDIEVRDGAQAAWVFEAKVGFAPPSSVQLSQYAERLNAEPFRAADRLLVVIARSDHRELTLPLALPPDVLGVPVQALSWGQIRTCAQRAYGQASNTGKATLRQFEAFLTKVLRMQAQESNEAFVVSLSFETFGGGSTTFVDVVTQHRKYFHPVGPGWPPDPPNYMAFRWQGRLQSVHHVDRYEVITGWQPYFPDTTEPTIAPHFLYHLGPPIVPTHPVATGKIFRAGRVWAAIDLLLTSASISEARDETQRRKTAAGAPAVDKSAPP